MRSLMAHSLLWGACLAAAVVARIVSADEILVDHANWYHGTVSRGMSVIDTSPTHDWTSVAVVHTPSGTHGADYPTYGFVYPRPAQREVIEAHDRSGSASYAADEDARPALFQLAVATEEVQRGSRAAGKISGTH